MAQQADGQAQKRGVPKAVLWTAGATAALALGVEYFKTGVDVLLVAVLVLMMVSVERLVGDWLGDLVGSALSTLVIAVFFGLGAYTLFSRSAVTDRIFLTAEGRGYKTMYYQPAQSAGAPLPAGPSSSGPDARPASPSKAAGKPMMAGTPAPVKKEDAVTNDDKQAGDVGLLQRWQRPVPEMLLDVPTLAMRGEALRVRTRVRSGNDPLAGVPVAVLIDGRLLETVSTSSDGVAMATFVPKAPGRFRLAAEFAGNDRYRSTSAAASITVLPGK